MKMKACLWVPWPQHMQANWKQYDFFCWKSNSRYGLTPTGALCDLTMLCAIKRNPTHFHSALRHRSKKQAGLWTVTQYQWSSMKVHTNHANLDQLTQLNKTHPLHVSAEHSLTSPFSQLLLCTALHCTGDPFYQSQTTKVRAALFSFGGRCLGR